jgi:hypothetical protein
LKGFRGGQVAAVATFDGKLPVFRFMVLAGFPGMKFVRATMKSSKKVDQQGKNADTSLNKSGQGRSTPTPVSRSGQRGRSTRMF